MGLVAPWIGILEGLGGHPDRARTGLAITRWNSPSIDQDVLHETLHATYTSVGLGALWIGIWRNQEAMRNELWNALPYNTAGGERSEPRRVAPVIA